MADEYEADTGKGIAQDSDLIEDLCEQYKDAQEADRENREEAVLDLEMAYGEQWDRSTRALREGNGENGSFPLPCLTINTLLQKVGQVTGDRAANPAQIKIIPCEDGDKQVADVRTDLLRSIQQRSRADTVYLEAFRQAVVCGRGFFRVDLDYTQNDVWNRDIFIRSIPNPMSVTMDYMATDPTGRDANYSYVTDRITKKQFETEYPDAEITDFWSADYSGSSIWSGDNWCDGKTVRICEYWQMLTKKRVLALMQDGTTRDVTDTPQEQWQPMLYAAQDGRRYVRKVDKPFARMFMTNGVEQLTDNYDLDIPRLPIIKVTGRQGWIGDRRVEFGLVRFGRDPQRLVNFFSSVWAELLMTAPRANFVAPASSVAGRESDWPNTLVYNDGQQKPEETTQANLSAILGAAQMFEQHMKDTTGIQDASLGIKSNESSGIAIQRRQQQGDIATIDFSTHMDMAITEGGVVANAMIPIAYDTARTVRTLGPDETVKIFRVNDPQFIANEIVKENVNITLGDYDVVVTTGPSYLTRRQESAATMTQLAQANPAILQRAGDLIVKAMDIPDADQIADRIRPPDVQDPNEQPNPQKQAAQAMQMQMAQMQMQQAQAMAAAELRLKNAQADKAEADAQKSMAEAQKAKNDAINEQADTALRGAALAHVASQPAEPPQVQVKI